MNLESILGKVVDAITGHDSENENAPNIRPASEDPMGDPADQVQGHQVLPASQDPMGDPADQFQGRQVLPASQDPLGDPADQFNGQQVRPASEDPLGDPADDQPQPAGAGRWRNARRGWSGCRTAGRCPARPPGCRRSDARPSA